MSIKLVNAPKFYHFWQESFLKRFYSYNWKKNNNNNINTSIQNEYHKYWKKCLKLNCSPQTIENHEQLCCQQL